MVIRKGQYSVRLGVHVGRDEGVCLVHPDGYSRSLQPIPLDKMLGLLNSAGGKEKGIPQVYSLSDTRDRLYIAPPANDKYEASFRFYPAMQVM